jgi:hypothetical protein
MSSGSFRASASRWTPPLAEHVREPHQLDELQQRLGRVAHCDSAPTSARCQLKAGESVDRHGVRLDPVDVAHDGPAAPSEDLAHAVAQPGEVRTRDGAANGERDLMGPGPGHRRMDASSTEN